MKEKKYRMKEITKSKSITLQMRDYEPANIFASVTFELGEDTPEVRKQVLQEANTFLNEEIKTQQAELVAIRKKIRGMEGKTMEQETKQAQKATTASFLGGNGAETEDDVIVVDDDGEQLVDEKGNVKPF